MKNTTQNPTPKDLEASPCVLSSSSINVPAINFSSVRNTLPSTFFFDRDNLAKQLAKEDADNIKLKTAFINSLNSTKADLLIPSDIRKTIREIESKTRSIPPMFVDYPSPVFYGDETSGVFKTSL